MLRRSVARGCIVESARRLLHELDQGLQIGGRDVFRIDDDYIGNVAEQRDGLKITRQVVTEVGIKTRCDCMMDRANEPRIAIWRLLCGNSCAHRSASTPAIVHNDWNR